MSMDVEGALLVRAVRGAVLAITSFILFQLQPYLTSPAWLIAIAFGLLGTMHSTERVARLGLSILIILALLPSGLLESAGRWLLALRNGGTL